MQVTTERIDNHKVALTMEVPGQEVTKAVDKAYHKLASQVNIPGFRKGKAPRKILEARLGKEAVMDEVFEILASPAYAKAIEEQKIEPVSRPEVEVIKLVEGQPFVFKAIVVVKPEVTLGQYKGLVVAKPTVTVSDEEVERSLENLRNRQAKMVVMEDATLMDGDFALIDFTGFVDDQPFEGGEAKGYPLEIGSGSFIPGFEEQLIGAKSGEERDVKVTFPADYHSADLAGKEALFKVKVNDVKRKELPAVDDEFVKDVSEFSTVDELKADLRNKLEQTAEQKAERDYHNAVVNAALLNTTVDIPEVMVEERITNMIEDLDVNLQNRGMKLDKYLEYTKMDMAALRSTYQEPARTNVKTDLMLEAIGKAEELEVKAEDMDAEIAAMAAGYGAPVEEVRKVILQQGRLATLAGSVLRKKALQLIMDSVINEEAKQEAIPEVVTATEEA